MRSDRIYCWEAFDGADPLVRAAERLYEQTQHPDERIPWGWIARSLKGRSQWKPGECGRHLVLATPVERPNELAGFAYGSYLPGFGGYVCYLGVDEAFRRRGVGTRLFDQAFKLLAADAGASDEPLPFVVWESHRPEPGASAADWKLWEARVRLFDRAGGLWLEGLELQTPNYGDSHAPTVPLQLFVKPMDAPVASLGVDALRNLAGGLLERIYKVRPGDPLYDATVTPDCHPRLRSALDAGRRTESRELLTAV